MPAAASGPRGSGSLLPGAESADELAGLVETTAATGAVAGGDIVGAASAKLAPATVARVMPSAISRDFTSVSVQHHNE